MWGRPALLLAVSLIEWIGSLARTFRFVNNPRCNWLPIKCTRPVADPYCCLFFSLLLSLILESSKELPLYNSSVVKLATIVAKFVLRQPSQVFGCRPGKKKELCFIRNRSSFAVCLDGLIIFSLIPHQPLYVPFQCSTVQRLSLKKNFKKEGGTKIKKKSNQIKKKLVFDCQLTNY